MSAPIERLADIDGRSFSEFVLTDRRTRDLIRGALADGFVEAREGRYVLTAAGRREVAEQDAADRAEDQARNAEFRDNWGLTLAGWPQ